jgi:hypothetical protein
LPSATDRAHDTGKRSPALRALIGGGLLALVSLLSVITWTVLQRRASVSSNLGSRAEEPRASTVGSRAEEPRASTVGSRGEEPRASTPVDHTGTLGAAQAASVSALPPSAPSVLGSPAEPPSTSTDAAVSAQEHGTQTHDRAGLPPDKHRPRPARKSGSPACDPPYSIDSAGRVLFKVECM